MLPTLTAAEFESQVLQSGKLVLVDFWSPTCGPCDLYNDVLAEVLAEADDDVVIFKVNVDNQGELAVQYQVIAMPTTKVFRNGECLKTVLGVQPKKNVLELISTLRENEE